MLCKVITVFVDLATPSLDFRRIRSETNNNETKRWANAASRLNVKAGNHVPVEILAEIDRRIDDGRPVMGTFQFSTYSAGYDEPPVTGERRCISVDAVEASWNVSGRQSNCGAVSLVN